MSDNPVQTLTDAIDAVANSDGVPASRELLALLHDARTWEQRVAVYKDPSQSDEFVIAYAAALTKELTP